MYDLNQVANIITEIGNTSSKKEKENIISAHKDNTLFADVLNFIFNPYIKTNIAKKKISKTVKAEKESASIETVYGFMDYLKQSSGRDSQIATVQAYISSQPAPLQWLLEAMAIKDLKIGATSSTINKAFGYDFIPTFDLMLAEKYIETKKIKGVSKVYEHWKRYLGQRVVATKKLDGNRCAIFVNDDGSVQLYSREGHLMEGYVEIEEAFKEFPKGQVYDGEVLATNEEGLNSKDLFKKTSKIVKKKGEKKGLEFHAFDILPIADFKKGVFEIHCERRKEMLARVIDMMNHPLVHYVEPLYIGDFDKEKIDALADEAKKNEEEGIMVQLADAPYECKRTFSILKVKSFESADIRCLDIYEGKSGKNIGRLGGLICDFKGHRVNIGGGFSDELRDEIWENPSMVIGKIVEIQYFEEFEEDGVLDLRFATFKTIRDDKSEPSYY
jgi:DNA ligase 1